MPEYFTIIGAALALLGMGTFVGYRLGAKATSSTLTPSHEVLIQHLETCRTLTSTLSEKLCAFLSLAFNGQEVFSPELERAMIDLGQTAKDLRKHFDDIANSVAK